MGQRVDSIVMDDAFEDAIESGDIKYIPETIPDVHTAHSTRTSDLEVLENSSDDVIVSSDTSVSNRDGNSSVHVASPAVASNLIVSKGEEKNDVGPGAAILNAPTTSGNGLVESTDDDDWDDPHQAQNAEDVEFDRLSTMSNEEELGTEPVFTHLNQQEGEFQQQSAVTTSMITDTANLVGDGLSSITPEPNTIPVAGKNEEISRVSAAIHRLNITTKAHAMSVLDQAYETDQIDSFAQGNSPSDEENSIHQVTAPISSGIKEEFLVIPVPKRETGIHLHLKPLCGSTEESPQVILEAPQEARNSLDPHQRIYNQHNLEQTECVQMKEEHEDRERFVNEQDIGETTSTNMVSFEDGESVVKTSIVVHELSNEEHDASTIEVDVNESSSTEAGNELRLSPSLDAVFVAPPPAPIYRPIVYGTLNPADENDDSDDSDEENDNPATENMPLPLNLSVSDDEEEELEVDQSVADAIRFESEKQKSKPKSSKKVEEPSLVKAMATAIFQTSRNDEIVIALEAETRAPHTVGFDSPLAVHTTESADYDAFGIGYQNIKPRRQSTYGKQPSGSEYSIPKSSTFPDEKEFENECELATDLQFSVRKLTRAIESPTATILIDKHDGEDEDDEFDAPITAVSEADISTDLASKRASFEARIASEQVALVHELKIETEQEHQQIVMEIKERGAKIFGCSQSKEDADQAFSVKELHSMYKRGLGDQSVLMMVNNSKEVPASSEGAPSENEAPRLSVMGRILSNKSVMSQAITEEDGEDDTDDDEGNREDQNEVEEDQESTRADREVLIEYTEAPYERESSASIDEWQEIELLQKKHTGVNANTPEPGADAPTSDDTFMILYPEASEYFSTAEEFLLQLDRIVVEDEGSPTKTSCFTCFARPRLVFAGANEERDRVFCIAATAYDPKNVIFVRTLQTIYCRFTSTVREVPLSGPHWESIGFQGNDPSTDLRGCGVLSLLQMLYLVENHTELARRFFRLAQHPLRHFPLACTLINVTLQCIVALRSGALFRECNKQNSIMNAINMVRFVLR